MTNSDATGVSRDVEGYLINPEDWNRTIAPALAAEEGIELDNDHWIAGQVMPNIRMTHRWLQVLLVGVGLAGAGVCHPLAAQSSHEVVSFRCALAIDAVLAELDSNSTNLVIQQALQHIDDVNGQLVCIPMSADEIQVRMQSTEMSGNDNRLVFSLDAKTYAVRKTFYGR